MFDAILDYELPAPLEDRISAFWGAVAQLDEIVEEADRAAPKRHAQDRKPGQRVLAEDQERDDSAEQQRAFKLP